MRIDYSAVGVAGLLTLASPLHADSVLTTAGRQEGVLRIHASKVYLDDANVAWNDTMTVTTAQKRRVTAPNVLTLKSGEQWSGTVLGLGRNELKFRLEQGGVRSLDLQLVAAVDFFAGRTAQAGRKEGRLYRKDGSSLKGKLVDINPYGVRIVSAIGVFNLPRSEVLRYVFGTVDVSAIVIDEVTHVNGSTYQGTVRPNGDMLELDHAFLGTLSFAVNVVQTVRRGSERWHWLDKNPWSSVTASTPLGPPPPPQLVSRNASPYQLRPPAWISAIHVEADSTVRIGRIPERPGRFMAFVIMPHGSPGAVISRIGSGSEGSQHVFDTPGSSAPWSFDLQPEGVLDLRFRFGDKIAMPCDALIGDPVIVWESVRGGDVISKKREVRSE